MEFEWGLKGPFLVEIFSNVHAMERKLQNDFCCGKFVVERQLEKDLCLHNVFKCPQSIVKYVRTWWKIPAQESNGVLVYFYKGSVDVDNNKIKDDMKATSSEETVCKLNMEATGTNNELYLQNVRFVKIR